MAKKVQTDSGYFIFRASKLDKDGNRIYARSYGKRAFKIWISTKKNA